MIAPSMLKPVLVKRTNHSDVVYFSKDDAALEVGLCLQPTAKDQRPQKHEILHILYNDS